MIGISVKVENIKTNEVFMYNTLTEAGKAIDVSRTAVKKALLKNSLIKNTFKITNNTN